jgi:putative ABC transport system permease protein
VQISRPERRSQEAERLMAGFKLGLSLAGMVALFVGGFIVYNALAIAVAQRRREIGILRALGATRGQVLLLFVGEGVVMGALGSLLGVGFGLVLARSVLRIMGTTISSLYVAVQPEALTVAPADVIAAVSLGVGAAFVAAFFPARNAASVEPASVMRKKTDASDVNFSSTSASLKASGVSVVVAAALAAYAHQTEDFMVGYAVAGILAFTAAFLSPALARGIGLAARSVAKRIGPAALLGTVSFTRNAGRNSVAIAALGIGLANVVNADAFVNSMKHNTARWFERSARADVFVFAGKKDQAKMAHPLPEEVGQELSKIAGVEFVDAYRSKRQALNGQPFQLVSYDLARYRRYNDVPVVAGDLDQAVAAIEAGKGVGASEVFAQTFKVGLGDKVTLQTAEGPRSFEIVLVYVDYTADLGILMTTRAVYRDLWKDLLVDSFGLYLKKGAVPDDVRQGILTGLGQRYSLLALSNGEYKAEVMKYIDGSFTLTRATEIIAIIVAVLGIINTLLVTVLDRRTEIGVLKAVGAEQRQIRSMLLTEGALIGLSATIVGICWGTLFSSYIVLELLRFQIGWQMSWELSGWVLLQTFVIAQVVTALAIWWPMRSAGRVDAVEALQYE